MPTNSPRFADLAGFSILRWPLVISLLTALSLFTACSNEAMTSEQPSASKEAASMRILVTLAPAPNGAVTKPGIEAAVAYLQAEYPGVRVLRTMPDFAQLLIELPASELAKLATDSLVLSAKPDASHHTTQRQP